MEEVLEIYHLSYNEDLPVVCLDKSNKQLVEEIRTPIPCKPGAVQRIDDEYVRNGGANIFMEVEPLAGKRHVGITARGNAWTLPCMSEKCLMNDTRRRRKLCLLWTT